MPNDNGLIKKLWFFNHQGARTSRSWSRSDRGVTSRSSITQMIKRAQPYWIHTCLAMPLGFVTFYISTLEILLLTYIITYPNITPLHLHTLNSTGWYYYWSRYHYILLPYKCLSQSFSLSPVEQRIFFSSRWSTTYFPTDCWHKLIQLIVFYRN